MPRKATSETNHFTTTPWIQIHIQFLIVQFRFVSFQFIYCHSFRVFFFVVVCVIFIDVTGMSLCDRLLSDWVHHKRLLNNNHFAVFKSLCLLREREIEWARGSKWELSVFIVRFLWLLSRLIDINENRVTIDFDTPLINANSKYINDNWFTVASKASAVGGGVAVLLPLTSINTCHVEIVVATKYSSVFFSLCCWPKPRR